MPLKKGKSKKVVSENIKEFHKGPTYARTEAKYGKADADKQAVAAAINAANPGVRANTSAVERLRKMKGKK